MMDYPYHQSQPQAAFPQEFSYAATNYPSSSSWGTSPSVAQQQAASSSSSPVLPSVPSSAYTQRKRARLKKRPSLAFPHSQPFGQPASSEDGLNDDDDDDDDTDSDDDEQENPAQFGYSTLPSAPLSNGFHPSSDHASDSASSRPPAKKRVHLDQEDVGRFAGMSIFEAAAQQHDVPSNPSQSPVRRRRGRTLVREPHHDPDRSPPRFTQTRAPPVSPAPLDRNRHGVFGVPLDSPRLEEFSTFAPASHAQAPPGTPLDEDVELMDTDRVASSWEVNPYTTYVNSLDDDDDDDDEGDGSINSEAGTSWNSDAHPNPSGPSGVRASGRATIPISKAEAEEHGRHQFMSIQALRTQREPHDASDSSSSAYEINPELLAKLEAHSRSVLIGGDMSRRRQSVPDAAETKGALVLWKSPEDLVSIGHRQMEAPSSSSYTSASTTAVLEEDHHHHHHDSTPVFAFGTPPGNSSTSSPTFSPSFRPLTKRRDFSNGSSIASSMSVTPVGSPRFTFSHASGGGGGESGMES